MIFIFLCKFQLIILRPHILSHTCHSVKLILTLPGKTQNNVYRGLFQCPDIPMMYNKASHVSQALTRALCLFQTEENELEALLFSGQALTSSPLRRGTLGPAHRRLGLLSTSELLMANALSFHIYFLKMILCLLFLTHSHEAREDISDHQC